jgi:hypothetical protein
VDIRDIATLHHHYSKHLEIPSVSTLTRTAIQFLSAVLVEKNQAREFLSTQEAVDYLETQGVMKPLRNRGQSALLRQMQKESLSLDGFNPKYAEGRSAVSEDQIQKAREILKQKQEEKTSGAILGLHPGEIKEDTKL